MLVLTRRKSEVICIGDDIKIMVCDIGGDRVRLGIEAPSDVKIHRQEVYDKIKSNLAADQPSTGLEV